MTNEEGGPRCRKCGQRWANHRGLKCPPSPKFITETERMLYAALRKMIDALDDNRDFYQHMPPEAGEAYELAVSTLAEVEGR